MSENRDEHDSIIRELLPVFKQVGFGDYAIDFSDVDMRLIQMLAETCKQYLDEESK